VRPGTAPQALIITPNPADAELALGFFAESGISASAYESISQLGGELPPHAACIVFAQEALLDADMPGLRELLELQPAWSDLPLVLVAGPGAGLGALVERAFPNAGNVTLLERPLNPLTLVSAVQVGLRARARQIEVRDLLEKRDDALRQRDNFLAMLAHELRNPLAPMLNAVYLLNTLQTGDPLIIRTRDILERQVSHMTRIVDDLLDVARFERGKIHLKRQRLDLNAAVGAAVEACMPAAHARSQDMKMALAPEPLFIDADPVRLEQLLSNLIVNASKFTPNAGKIEVQTSRDAEMAWVNVRDNGVGIRPEMIERIFAPFAQDDDSLARSAGGLGIGLSIARAIAELHGGSLHARSEGVSKGASFQACFPLSTAQAAAVHGKRAAPVAIRRRILVVEDNSDIRETLHLVLESQGHEVMLAATGDEGLKLALKEKPDVALIDIGLPGMSGYEVAVRIREGTRHWPVRMRMVAMTGYGQPSDVERAASAGFDHHLLKPVDPQLLDTLLGA
jgi:two-component system, sensor histidine kinase